MQSSSGRPEFLFASATLLVYSFVSGWSGPNSSLSLLALLASMACLVAPAILENRRQMAGRLSTALTKLEARQYDLDGVRREHRKAQTRYEGLQEESERLVQQLSELSQAESASLREEVMELRRVLHQERRVLARWVEGLIEYADGLERSLSLEGLAEGLRDAQRRCLDELSRTFASLGVDVIVPASGDQFQDHIHQAVGETPSPDLKPDQIVQCERRGYRQGTQVFRKAAVLLAARREEKSSDES